MVPVSNLHIIQCIQKYRGTAAYLDPVKTLRLFLAPVDGGYSIEVKQVLSIANDHSFYLISSISVTTFVCGLKPMVRMCDASYVDNMKYLILVMDNK